MDITPRLAALWRLSVESWLRRQDLIVIRQSQNESTTSPNTGPTINQGHRQGHHHRAQEHFKGRQIYSKHDHEWEILQIQAGELRTPILRHLWNRTRYEPAIQRIAFDRAKMNRPGPIQGKLKSLKIYWAIHLIALLFCSTERTFSQPIYFIDGQHGGVYGHYPLWVTQFLVDQLNQHPDWRINLEIEPVTWDVVQTNTPEAYDAFKHLFADQSDKGRIEYADPQYGQSFLWNISGESMIRQFDYGMQKVRQHFPNARFTTYSAEEPMFTSALPGILRSFGFSYASLKNPNTCWGGYTRAFGGELVNWIGPDGTKITTVPRYAIEALQPGSTWQTIASINSTDYINAAFAAGIRHPVGMCFQDAGWRIGPWLGEKTNQTHPLVYETWRNYFETVAKKSPSQDWHFSQEDVLVSLVWGSQVLQQLAQHVRAAENRIVDAEKLAAMARIYAATPWPKPALDEAWRTLLLSEHHDCWIVPYNLKNDRTWAQNVAEWTASTMRASDELMQESINALSGTGTEQNATSVTVFNTTGVEHKGVVSVILSNGLSAATRPMVLDDKGRETPSQPGIASGTNDREILFQADVPSVGYKTYTIKPSASPPSGGANVMVQADGTYKLETDLYRIVFDPSKGGVIRSLVAKKLGKKDFVDATNARSFDEIRGCFYKSGGFCSSADNPARITILQSGPLQLRLAIEGTIDTHPFIQTVTVAQGQSVIDMRLKINWQGNPGIGSEYRQTNAWQNTNNAKAFYDGRYKLLALFPLNLEGQRVFKNAPFDVTESKLTDTFFTTWSGIKNDVILNWVDVVDASTRYGLALLTDHTTSYAHGADFPLGLTLQYSGMGLWGRNYRINGPTEVHYALIPHAGNWKDARIWTESDQWNQPLIAAVNSRSHSADSSKSLIDVTGTGLEVSAVLFEGNDLLVRVFNAEGDSTSKTISYSGTADKVQLVELSGNVVEQLRIRKSKSGGTVISVALPRFAVRTIKFCNVVPGRS